MIRTDKPVKLLEWDLGTNTTNQRWQDIGKGVILSTKRKDGVTTMVVEIEGRLQKQNPNDNTVKVAQLEEGMAPRAKKWGEITPRWGEVAMGKISSIEEQGFKSKVNIEISAATKTGLSFK